MNHKRLCRGLAVTATLLALIGVSATPVALAHSGHAGTKKCVKKPIHPGCARLVAPTTAPPTTVAPAATATTVPRAPVDPRIVIAPTTVTETSADGLVGFAISGSGWVGNVKLSSPGLDIACPGNSASPFKFSFGNRGGVGPSGFTVPSDSIGQFKVVGDGASCAPGTYTVEAQETVTPFRLRTATITINAGTLPAGLIVSPNAQAGTGTNREIAVALIVNGLSSNQPFAIASPGLNTACSAASVAAFNRPLTFTALPARGPGFSTKATGNAALVLVLNSCVPGDYPITLTEIGGLARTFSPTFTVAAS